MTSSTVGKFYEVSRGAIDQVARHSNRAAVVLAYLALKRYQQRHNTNVVSGGRPALAKVLGISQRRAKKLMDELRSIAWGKSHHETALMDAYLWNKACSDAELVSLGHAGGGRGSNKVMPPWGDDFIYLPNSLTEQSPRKKHSPLGQLYHLSDKETRLHATMLLLALYEHLDMQHCGGADPAATFYIPWRYNGYAEREGIKDFMPLGHLGVVNRLHYWSVDYRHEDGAHWTESLTTAHWAFIESITGETAADKKAPKFWSASRALRDLGLVFHVAMVFDSDPLQDPDAGVLYPLWVFNQAEKKRLDKNGYHEGGLGQLAANKALRDSVSDDLAEAMEAIFESSGEGGILMLNPTGWFIVAADNPDARVLGILRPRFIPNTMDGQAGWASLRDKSAEWTDNLKR